MMLLYNDNCYKYEKYIQIINMQRRYLIYLNEDHDIKYNRITDELMMKTLSRHWKKEEYVWYVMYLYMIDSKYITPY